MNTGGYGSTLPSKKATITLLSICTAQSVQSASAPQAGSRPMYAAVKPSQIPGNVEAPSFWWEPDKTTSQKLPDGLITGDPGMMQRIVGCYCEGCHLAVRSVCNLKMFKTAMEMAPDYSLKVIGCWPLFPGSY